MWIEIDETAGKIAKALSLSARRVWIEIRIIAGTVSLPFCHSPRGGCGLKYGLIKKMYASILSLSARRVWIEMP